jgi:hypothetical protein
MIVDDLTSMNSPTDNIALTRTDVDPLVFAESMSGRRNPRRYNCQ